MWIAPKTWTSEAPPHGSTLTAGRPASTSARCSGVSPTWPKSAASFGSRDGPGAANANGTRARRHREGLSIAVMASPHENEVDVGRNAERRCRLGIRGEGGEIRRVPAKMLLERG